MIAELGHYALILGLMVALTQAALPLLGAARRSALLMDFAPAAAVALLVLLAGGARALDPAEQLPDPALEARARALSKELRCLVCQNESIDDSNADLARDLRTIVRQRLVAGDSDGAVKDYLVARYGDFVLLEPPVKAKTYALWFGPAAVLVLGALGVLAFFRRRAGAPTAAPPLSADEERRIAQLLDGDGGRR